ncbi:MAG: ROK family transcriptional regulator [Hyphomicrobiales bacterium]|nr:ROK family transcriptional regulator [Hyphomicrobiales bacterium]
MRDSNDRLVLSLLRREGPLPKIEISRRTGLSAQAGSAIVTRLEERTLLRRLEPTRGRVGQPAVPYVLRDDGAFSLGLKLGRRSADLALLDFLGKPRWTAHETYPWPTPEGVAAFVSRALPRALGQLDARKRRRVVGLGVATPFELWNWGPEVGGPRDAMEAWRGVDVGALIAPLCPLPTYVCNDASAACAGEMHFGEGWRDGDFVYFFVGSFVGGGVALGGALFQGRDGNAGALGSMPVSARGGGGPQQLIRRASIYLLEEALKREGRDPSPIWRDPRRWGDLGPALDSWIDDAADALAQATVAAAAVIACGRAVIDGAFPAEVRARLVNRTAERMASLDLQGLSPISVREGSIGADARSIGAGALPFLANFAHEGAGALGAVAT